MLMQNVEVRVNDYPLPGSSYSDVNIKDYVGKVMTYEENVKNTQLQAQMFYPDTAGQHNSLVEAANAGFKIRKALTAESKVFDFIAPISSDFLQSNNHLGPTNKLGIKIYRASDQQLIMSKADSGYRIKIKVLDILYSRILTSIPRPMREVHLITHTELMRFPMATATTNIILNVQQGGKLPRQVIVFFVITNGLNGDYVDNMTKFEHLNISEIQLKVNGRPTPPGGLTPDFTNKLVSREYASLFQNTGCYRMNKGNLITKDQFIGGTTLFPFDLSPDKCNGFHLHEAIDGTIEVEAKCAAMTKPTTALVYLAWDMEVTLYQDTGTHSLAYMTTGGAA
jgi:hypothetical protein